MSFKHQSILLILTLNTIHTAMPIRCHDLNCKNYMRTHILDRLDRALPDACELKEKAGKGIRFRLLLDAASPFIGFPRVQNSENCTILQIQNCFNEDCRPLRMLIHYLEIELAKDFPKEISKITSQIKAVVEQMNCINMNSISIPNINSPMKKEKKYILVKDTVQFLRNMTMKYISINTL